MSTITKRGTILLATTLIAVGLGGAAFGVDDSKEVRQADFIASLGACDTCTDVRTAGHYEFLEEGLHVYTDDATSQAKVALYFAPRSGDDIPTSASQDWYGTDPEPGKQIVFDFDGTTGNGNDFNILVGEPVYGDNWWLTNGSSADAKAADPSGANDGGNGSAYFGTLAEWKAAMPNARVGAYGFSLGSGVKGDGVLRAQTYDGTEYIFTDEAATPAPVTPEQHTASAAVTGSGTWDNSNRLARISLHSTTIPANDTGRGTKLRWDIKVAGVLRYSSNNGWGDSTTWRYAFGTAGGSVKVEVFRNGALYSTRYITTR